SRAARGWYGTDGDDGRFGSPTKAGDPVTEQQLARMAKRRLAILRHAEEITGNVALTCRYFGISRQCFYTLRRRYDADGLDGLRDCSHCCSWSSRAPACTPVPRAT